MHNMLAIYRHKGHSSRNSSPVISLILRNAEDDDIDNSRVSIKDHSNLGLFIGYLQSGTIRRSRQMHYHRNHLSPPLENQPNISCTVLAKCFWEMFNVSSFRRQTIPFISVQFWSHEECRRRPFLVDCDKRKCFDLRFLWSENCRSNNSNSYFLGSVDVDDCYARRRVLVTLKCLDNGKQWRALRSPQVLYYKPSLHSALEAALIGGPPELG